MKHFKIGIIVSITVLIVFYGLSSIFLRRNQPQYQLKLSNPGWPVFEDVEAGFRFQYPESWRITPVQASPNIKFINGLCILNLSKRNGQADNYDNCGNNPLYKKCEVVKTRDSETSIRWGEDMRQFGCAELQAAPSKVVNFYFEYQNPLCEEQFRGVISTFEGL